MKRIHTAAHLHDIGKIGVADRVLFQEGKRKDRKGGSV
jgi:response regulator RpfG family c-di-GMP phosphodiesterase